MTDNSGGGGGGSIVYDAAHTANWKLDDDDGNGCQLNSSSRAMLMAKLGGVSAPQTAQAVPMVMMSAPTVPQPLALPPMLGTPSCNFTIRNMFVLEEENEQDWDSDVREDVRDECAKYGTIVDCSVETKVSGGLVYVRFANVQCAVTAAQALHGRFFAGKMITIQYTP